MRNGVRRNEISLRSTRRLADRTSGLPETHSQIGYHSHWMIGVGWGVGNSTRLRGWITCKTKQWTYCLEGCQYRNRFGIRQQFRNWRERRTCSQWQTSGYCLVPGRTTKTMGSRLQLTNCDVVVGIRVIGPERIQGHPRHEHSFISDERRPACCSIFATSRHRDPPTASAVAGPSTSSGIGSASATPPQGGSD